MKKFFLSVVAILVMLSLFAVSFVGAQDAESEALPSCSAEDYAANLEALGEAFTGLGDLTTLPEEPSASDFSGVVAIVDAFATGYWEGFDLEAISCAEEFYIGTTAGLIFDEMVIVSSLNALAVHESDAGNTELADILLEQATARAETLQAGLEELGVVVEALMAGEEVELDVAYPECSEEEFTAAVDGLSIINETYAEFGAALEEELTGADLSALVTGFAELSGGYWSEFYPEIPLCAEAQYLAYEYGLVLDESLITVSILRLAELEAELGNDELSEFLAESAATRAEYLTEMATELFGMEEEE